MKTTIRLFILAALGLRVIAQPATITVQTDQRLDRIEPLLCGQFIEHLGRCINGGIFEPDSPLSDTNGFSLDVLEKVRELNPTLCVGLVPAADGARVGAETFTTVATGTGPVWTRHTIDNTSRGADGVKLGDLDGDNLLDIVTGWEAEDLLSWPGLPAEDRAMIRARLALAAYLYADGDVTSKGTGTHHGNANRGVARQFADAALLPALLPDHPMSKSWADYWAEDKSFSLYNTVRLGDPRNEQPFSWPDQNVIEHAFTPAADLRAHGVVGDGGRYTADAGEECSREADPANAAARWPGVGLRNSGRTDPLARTQ